MKIPSPSALAPVLTLLVAAAVVVACGDSSPDGAGTPSASRASQPVADVVRTRPRDTESAPAQGDEHPPENEICPVMGNPVDPRVFVDYEGRRIGFCCPGCDQTFQEDPETYLRKVDAEIAARAAK